MVLENYVKTQAKKLGFAACGFADVDCLKQKIELLVAREQVNASCPLETADVVSRTEPQLLQTTTKTIIALALPYDKSNFWEPGICASAQGIDYHIVVKKKLEQLASELKILLPELKYTILVDNNPLLERSIAEAAGLGWIGKNGMLIVPEIGSFVALGEILVNVSLTKAQPLKEQCGTCQKCIIACPAQAIASDKRVIAKNCLSWLSQKKEELTKKEIALLGNKIFGCDACQLVCPYNQVYLQELQYGDLSFNQAKLESMSKQEFRNEFGEKAYAWRGKKQLLKNYLRSLKYGTFEQ
ncbi:MAG: tRNA epoxyqueuosine(34) reductase QueG [Clostridia bacterium]